MKRIFAILMVAVVLLLSLSLIACDEDNSEQSENNGAASYDNPNDGTFGVDFGDIVGSGFVFPDDEFE